MKLSNILQYWLLIAIAPLVSLAAPVKRPASRTPSPGSSPHPPPPATPDSHGFHSGQVVAVAPNNFVGADPASLSRNIRKASGGRHPAIITDGPHPGGHFTVAPVSHNPDPVRNGRPTIDAQHVVPHGHPLTGWIGLKPEQSKHEHMAAHTHHPDLPPHSVDHLRAEQHHYSGWIPGDPVKPHHSGPTTGQRSSHHSGQSSGSHGHTGSTSHQGSHSQPSSHSHQSSSSHDPKRQKKA